MHDKHNPPNIQYDPVLCLSEKYFYDYNIDYQLDIQKIDFFLGITQYFIQ